MIKIRTWRDPYDAGFSVCNPREISLKPGLTVLVGCNGCGKTTLLKNIKDEAKKSNIPCHLYNNLSDGGGVSIGNLLSGYGDEKDIALGIEMFAASEGEAIRLNLERQKSLYSKFIHEGIVNDLSHRLAAAFGTKQTVCSDTRRILLFDAVDSGLSIDMVCDIKAFYHALIEKANEDGLEFYVVIAANEYELCDGEDCFDVNEGTYITFVDYSDYKKFILKSRERKIARYKKQIVWEEKKKASERKRYEQLKARAIEKARSILEKSGGDSRFSFGCRARVDDAFRPLLDFANECRDRELCKEAMKAKEDFITLEVESKFVNKENISD